jgi:hypothetical protein
LHFNFLCYCSDWSICRFQSEQYKIKAKIKVLNWFSYQRDKTFQNLNLKLKKFLFWNRYLKLLPFAQILSLYKSQNNSQLPCCCHINNDITNLFYYGVFRKTRKPEFKNPNFLWEILYFIFLLINIFILLLLHPYSYLLSILILSYLIQFCPFYCYLYSS